jgi:hypothetical protein
MRDDEAPDYDRVKLQKIAKNPLIIAVAGHANHGKTSVIRTLCRMRQFGEVRDLPGTTKSVEGVRFKIESQTYMIVFDTPGFQYASEAIDACGEHFTVDAIQEFFAGREQFRSDREAIEQVRRSDLVLYVVDSTCHPSETLRSDFLILARSGVPVIPLFNFCSNPQPPDSEVRWSEFLHRNNYHLDVRYDAHFYRPDLESELYKRIDVLLKDPDHREFFHWHTQWRKSRETRMSAEAVAAIAEMLVDCAAYRQTDHGVRSGERKAREQTSREQFQNDIADRERRGFRAAVKAYEFPEDMLECHIESGETSAIWRDELFGNRIRRHLGIGLLGGAGAGAATGLAVDAMFFGTSWGTAALSGAVIGAILGCVGMGFYNQKYDSKSQTLTVQSTKKMRQVLVERSIGLLLDLRHRGMADGRDFQASYDSSRFASDDLKALFEKLEDVADRLCPRTMSADVEARDGVGRGHDGECEREDFVGGVRSLMEAVLVKASREAASRA